ncbi:SDR family oxidoreductase [Pseudomonas sp. v388]|uniref:SDR family oxidoreductase n=1 Tax=Pseudomonas sp. v388 TaxID=2479849 RepID=UPI000F792A31|nr:SDR family oxidoreductase [Pseudomonas sp. v388]RRV10828.1 SDR family oxidoreductase [Pseudomonas sp. v388]
MIDSKTGMKPGERYSIKSSNDAHPFTGFFLDGKYYLAPDLQTAVGWLEEQEFIYDHVDSSGEPVFPNRLAGTIENLTLSMSGGERLQLIRENVSLSDEPPIQASDAEESGRPAQASLNGKLVVITGASSGIGRATAKAFACEGARLVLAARDEEALYEVLDECTECGTDAIAIATDVTVSGQMENLSKHAAEFGNGRIDIWVNNAGVGAVGAFEETPLEAHERVIQTDLVGYLRGAYVALPYFKAQQDGILINTLSLGSWVAQPYAAAYSAAKFGLRGLTEALRGELTGFPNIHVCDIYPAVMDTPGFCDGGNYTGHALKPPSPVYDPHLVADAMVACAINPRPSTTVGGTAYLARFSHFLVPRLNHLIGRFTRWGIQRSPISPLSSGNLFGPPEGERRVEGGRRDQSIKPLTILALASGLLVAGCGYVLLRSRRR